MLGLGDPRQTNRSLRRSTSEENELVTPGRGNQGLVGRHRENRDECRSEDEKGPPILGCLKAIPRALAFVAHAGKLATRLTMRYPEAVSVERQKLSRWISNQVSQEVKELCGSTHPSTGVSGNADTEGGRCAPLTRSSFLFDVPVEIISRKNRR